MRYNGLLLLAVASFLLGVPYSSQAACTTDAACNDLTICNGAETCQGGVCTPGIALDCDDNDPATSDSCHYLLGCQHAPDGVPDPGCDDFNPCTRDTSGVGGCEHTSVADGTSCTDLADCNGAETCQGGVCTPGTPIDCGLFASCSDPARALAVWEAAAAFCPCEAPNQNHGQYVRCVKGLVANAVTAGLPRNCKGRIKRCAARSACGKQGFVTCCFVSAGSCVDGRCQDGATACTTAADCAPRTRCSVKAADICRAQGGSPRSGSCCDAVCSLPPCLQPRAGVCSSNGECPAGTACAANVDASVCAPPGSECFSDADCGASSDCDLSLVHTDHVHVNGHGICVCIPPAGP